MKFLKRMFPKRMKDVDLSQESCQAADYYIKHRCQGAILADQVLAGNAVSHGFFMGVRWYEKHMLGLKKGSENGK